MNPVAKGFGVAFAGREAGSIMAEEGEMVNA